MTEIGVTALPTPIPCASINRWGAYLRLLGEGVERGGMWMVDVGGVDNGTSEDSAAENVVRDDD